MISVCDQAGRTVVSAAATIWFDCDGTLQRNVIQCFFSHYRCRGVCAIDLDLDPMGTLIFVVALVQKTKILCVLCFWKRDRVACCRRRRHIFVCPGPQSKEILFVGIPDHTGVLRKLLVIRCYLGITYSLKNQPLLDKNFIPFGVWAQAYLKDAAQPFRIAVERENGLISVFETKLRGPEFAEANYRYAERFVKMLLWSVGGWRVYLCGDDALAERMQDAYRAGGKREFDVGFMQDVYERPFEIVITDEANFPQVREQTRKVGGHTNGCRIGFDAGGSDRKVSAVVDGETVYSEEVVWHPKTSVDPQYQYDGIVSAFKTAASKMPRVDAIGVSSAGVFIGNAPMVSSIFLKVPRERREEVKTIFDRAAKELGDVPIVVANDGDVSALAGSMSLGAGCVMGLAMGTSEAVGYVNHESNLLGWISELAFAPADLNEHAMRDEWSGDIGVGCKYFSQDAVIKLAPAAGIALAESLTPAEKLKEVQKLAEQGVSYAQDIFKSIGVYLGHTLCLYEMFYDIRNLIVLGRVASGVGGDLIVAECQRVLNEEYPELAQKLCVMLPDEEFRRVGQSMAAASLPEV